MPRPFWPVWLAPALMASAIMVVLPGCSSPTRPGDNPPPPPPDAATLVGAGDIALCGSPGAEDTARIIEATPGTVFTAGDNAYFGGAAIEFAECYDPTWGRFKDRTFPVPGNHDYEDPPNDAHAYFDYFGSAAGQRGQGYYKYNVGSWRVIALNSEFLPGGRAPNAAAATAQMNWLRTELSTNVPCTMAIWHRPLYSSGRNHSNPDLHDLYKLLYDQNADVVVTGHDHNYERFAPQDADGRADPARGMRQFVVGTGGIDPYTEFSKVANSETFQSNTWGVIKFQLGTGTYTWDYIPVKDRGVHDTGSGVCH